MLEAQNKCGFKKEDGEFRPVFEINDREGVKPCSVIYLKSPTKIYKYVLVEEEE